MKEYLELKEALSQKINEKLADLIALNDDLADHPEIGGQEFRTSKAIVKVLEDNGFKVEMPFDNLETAFRGIYGPNNHKYKVALMAEYDALPGIGHACGHCVSGCQSVLAAIALAPLQDELDCDIHIIGTPNEEADGAKCYMTDDGVFNDYDMAMMIHLYDRNLLYCKLLGIQSYFYTYKGVASHASASPWDGVNALNAAQLQFHGIDMLRQHVTSDTRMHGIYKEAGEAPNIVPERAKTHFYYRALDKPYLTALAEKGHKIAEGAAMMTGTTMEYEVAEQPYDSMKNNDFGLGILEEVYNELGIDINGDHDKIFGSSDAGNVSWVCPTFHPTLQLVDYGIPIHTREFEEAVKSCRAHDLIAEGAMVMGLQTIKIFMDEENVRKMKEDFEK